MNINRINSTNFNGIYRIKNTPKNLDDMMKHVLPMYSHLRHEPVFVFSGRNPFKAAVDMLMELIADSQKSTIEWLKMNAEIHGLNLSKLNDDEIHIISGKQKTEEIVEYIKHRVEKQTGFWSNLKKQFSINNNDDIKRKPEHLRPLAIALQDNETEEAAFLEKYSSQIVEVKTTQDLLRNLLTERY